MLKWIRTPFLLGIEDGHSRRFIRSRLMVIGDNHIQPQIIGIGHILLGRNPAIHCNQKFGLLAQGPKGIAVQPISFLKPIGKIVANDPRMRRQFAQRKDQQSGGRLPVSVIVTINYDRFLAIECLPDALYSLSHSEHQKGIRSVLQIALEELFTLGPGCDPAIDQNLGYHWRNAQRFGQFRCLFAVFLPQNPFLSFIAHGKASM